MSVVGRAYVTVRAVTRQVEGDVQKGVDNALKNVEDRTAKAAGDKVGKGVGKGVGDGVAGSDIDKRISESVRKYDGTSDGQRIGNQLGDAINEGLSGLGAFDRFFDRLGERMGIDAEREGKNVGRKFGQGAVKGAAGVATNPMVWIGALGLPAISDGLSAVNAAVASSTALVSTLGPTMAASATVGGSAMFGLAQTIGTVTTSFKVKTPELEDFKASLRGVRDEWIGIATDSQQVLLPAIQRAATGVTENLGPTLRDGMVETAEAVGVVTDRFVTLSENEMFQRRLGTVLRSNADALKDFGTAGVLAFGSATTLASAAAPLTTRFSEYVRQAALAGNQTLAVADQTGRLDQFFQEAGNTTAQWGRVLGDVTGLLGNVFSAGLGEGNRLLDMVENQTTKWEAWTDSVEGQNAIEDWFETATPVMTSFGNLLGGLTEGIGNWAGGNEQAAKSLDAIASVLPGLGTFLGELSAGGRDLVAAVAPALANVADLGPAVRDTASELADRLGPALEMVVPEAVAVAEAALKVVGELGPVLTVAGEVGRVAGTILTPALEGTATILDKLPDNLVGVAGAAVGLRIALGALGRNQALAGLSARISDQMAQIRTDMEKTKGAGGRFKVGLSGAMGILGGPWGLALGAGVTAIGLFAQAQAEADQRIGELSQSLNQQTGAITANTREIIARQLEEQGVLADAESLGISMQRVTDAAMGKSDALKDVNTQLDAYAATALLSGEAGIGTSQFINNVSDAINGQNKELNEAIDSTKRVATASKEYDDSVRSVTNNVGAAAKVEDQLGRSAGRAATDIDRQAQATKSLSRETLVFHETALKMIQGQIGLEQAVDDAFKEIEKGRKTLDIGTQAGRDNMNALLGIAEAANGVTGSAEKQEKALRRAQDRIAGFADQMGLSGPAAKRLAERLIGVKEAADKVPEEVNTRIEVESQEARRELMNFSAAMRGLDGQVAKTFIENTISTVEGKLDRPNRAGGGWIIGPGTSTSDDIPYGNANVSNREFVVNAQAAAENAALLEAINSGRLGGGSSTAPSQQRSGGGQGTMVYIDKLMPPNYGEFIGEINSRKRDKNSFGGTEF